MVADVPVGVLLSGGIDRHSSSRYWRKPVRAASRPSAWASSRPGANRETSSSISDLVAKQFGTDHRQIMVERPRLLPAISARGGRHERADGEPRLRGFLSPLQEVSRDVKVVQSGQGADEVLGGYDWYPPLASVARARCGRGLRLGLL